MSSGLAPRLDAPVLADGAWIAHTRLRFASAVIGANDVGSGRNTGRFGFAGVLSADYYLQTVDSVDLTPGCVDFVVRSHAQTLLNVDGHTPCDAPDDCPDGQTCDLMIQTCV